MGRHTVKNFLTFIVGTRLFLSDLKPGTDYDVVIESKARHLNNKDAWDRDDEYLCKERSEMVTVRTAHPPIPPTEFAVVGGTTKSLKLAWNEPISRGLKVNKFLISVEGPAPDGWDGMNVTLDSGLGLGDTARSQTRSRTKRNRHTKSNEVQILPRVYEV